MSKRGRIPTRDEVLRLTDEGNRLHDRGSRAAAVDRYQQACALVREIIELGPGDPDDAQQAVAACLGWAEGPRRLDAARVIAFAGQEKPPRRLSRDVHRVTMADTTDSRSRRLAREFKDRALIAAQEDALAKLVSEVLESSQGVKHLQTVQGSLARSRPMADPG
jgi:hypothetical protein